MPILRDWATASSVSLSHWYTSLNQPIVQTAQPPPLHPHLCHPHHLGCPAPLWRTGQRLLSARLFTDQRFSSGFQIDGIIFLIKRDEADEGGWGSAGERMRQKGAGWPRPPLSLLMFLLGRRDDLRVAGFFPSAGWREAGED